MVIRRDASYEMVKNDVIVNQLLWSVTENNIRIIEEIYCEDHLNELMNAFISDAQYDNQLIIPLSPLAQFYFENEPTFNYLIQPLELEVTTRTTKILI
ncbi:hypothetical protein [Vagococcus hydrophili]|uniref:Uncharacterized protein n=1 Tax=Vagococcus hydrophili TaxID=2714947 RepID=A0A6G8AVS9_9ENTE|nr:hypothetical protein [Vagococcus hydrophili]QIL49062.1 hypothetical protein G7082_11480 [Vagococcus hydrophili]